MSTGIEQIFQAAVAQFAAGRLGEAEAGYRQVLARNPRHAGSLHHLGMIAHRVGRLDIAADLVRQAIAIDAGDPAAHCNLALVLRDAGRPDEAAVAAQAALARSPAMAEAHNNLGNALQDLGRYDEAAASFRAAIRRRPGYVDAHSNLSSALTLARHYDQAVAAARTAVALGPDNPTARNNLGAALIQIGDFSGALRACREAIALRPGHGRGYANLANALEMLDLLDRAVAAGRRAVALSAADPMAHWFLANALLAAGRLAEGWPHYEWRNRLSHLARRARTFSSPAWRGEPASGRLLVHAEQGFGDIIQFCRYVPLVAARGLEVVLEAPPALRRLLGSLVGVSELVEPDAPVQVDLHCSVMSLPYVFGTTLDSIPAAIPYLAPPPDAVRHWAARLAADRGFRVGLVWSGNPDYPANHRRRIDPALLDMLAEVPRVSFYSLQKGDRVAPPPAGLAMVDLTADLGDFAETAALIANLDLVITVDTAVAHLAGAIGRPVWVMNRLEAEWRWLRGRDDSPWYPTLRQFRQPAAGDWRSVVGQVRAALSALAAQA